ncbi:uncharacterized protein LOC144013950 isoform X2 [Festucalex cinctus]
MYTCCVLGCSNSRSSDSKLKFYRLPTEYRPFQAKRRRLWLKVIQQVNGNAEELKENARICGAHFISGQASMEEDNPDFVPSVFTNVKSSSKSQSRRVGRKRKKCHWRHRKNKELSDDSEEVPIKDEEPEVQQPSVETTESQPSQDAQTTTEKASTEETKSDTEMTEIPRASFGETPSPVLKPAKTSPVVLLKHIVAPTGIYLCELCNQNFSTVAQLVKHKIEHEGQRSPIGGDVQEKIPAGALAERDEPSFPCNICDRTFNDRRHLKRHKLLHMRDVRKCQTCGVLFCQQHRRTLLVAQPVVTSECDDVCSVSECDDVCSVSERDDVCPIIESGYVLEPGEVVEPQEDFHTSWAFVPLLGNPTFQNGEPQASASGTTPQLFDEMPPPLHPLSVPICPEAKPSDISASEAQKAEKCEALKKARPYQPPKLPPALRMFSPQFLTSAFFEVQRNYEYILGKRADVPIEIDVKNEPAETHLPPDVADEEPEVNEPTAFDLEIVL